MLRRRTNLHVFGIKNWVYVHFVHFYSRLSECVPQGEEKTSDVHGLAVKWVILNAIVVSAPGLDLTS